MSNCVNEQKRISTNEQNCKRTNAQKHNHTKAQKNMSTQLEDFKRALGLDDNYQEAVTPQPAAPAQEMVSVKKESKGLPRRTICIPGPLHTRISLLGLWMDREGIMDNPKLYEVITAAIDEYVNHHPAAASYVNKV